ncbi:unnamed protein product, partial [Ectocarpus sp. 6 AP-2014]
LEPDPWSERRLQVPQPAHQHRRAHHGGLGSPGLPEAVADGEGRSRRRGLLRGDRRNDQHAGAGDARDTAHVPPEHDRCRHQGQQVRLPQEGGGADVRLPVPLHPQQSRGCGFIKEAGKGVGGRSRRHGVPVALSPEIPEAGQRCGGRPLSRRHRLRLVR